MYDPPQLRFYFMAFVIQQKIKSKMELSFIDVSI